MSRPIERADDSWPTAGCPLLEARPGNADVRSTEPLKPFSGSNAGAALHPQSSDGAERGLGKITFKSRNEKFLSSSGQRLSTVKTGLRAS